MTTFLEQVLKNAEGKIVADTIKVRSATDLRQLSYYTVCAIADTFSCNPFGRIQFGAGWDVSVDDHGNFLSAVEARG
jgi:hypothetical protein